MAFGAVDAPTVLVEYAPELRAIESNGPKIKFHALSEHAGLVFQKRLRQSATRTGRSTSDVVRAALQAYLDQPDAGPARSAFELGADLFGRHRGSADLATQRKRVLTAAWGDRHARRGA